VTKTFHIYPSDGGWIVQKEGRRAESFRTQREAVEAARQIVKDNDAGQLVIYGRDGRIRDHETYGMSRIQDPPRKSRLAKRIQQAVSKVTLGRLQSNPHSCSDYSPAK
jgi:hypothetical protein